MKIILINSNAVTEILLYSFSEISSVRLCLLRTGFNRKQIDNSLEYKKNFYNQY